MRKLFAVIAMILFLITGCKTGEELVLPQQHENYK
jgi:uncharacterized protein YcfL